MELQRRLRIADIAANDAGRTPAMEYETKAGA